MIRSQRKFHRHIWTLWALLLPAGIVLAWLAVPVDVPVKLLKQEAKEVLPKIIRSAEMAEYAVSLRTDVTRTKWQLEWNNKKTLTVPSAVIYDVSASGGEISGGRLIGRIEANGNYLFDLPGGPADSSAVQLVLFDFIHERKINSINL